MHGNFSQTRVNSIGEKLIVEHELLIGGSLIKIRRLPNNNDSGDGMGNNNRKNYENLPSIGLS